MKNVLIFGGIAVLAVVGFVIYKKKNAGYAGEEPRKEETPAPPTPLEIKPLTLIEIIKSPVPVFTPEIRASFDNHRPPTDVRIQQLFNPITSSGSGLSGGAPTLRPPTISAPASPATRVYTAKEVADALADRQGRG